MAGPSEQSTRAPGPVQRARSRRTRERVVRAAIVLIAEEGLASATGPRIAEHSGVSWGGIQHQFGDKAAIVDAVLEQVLVDFEHQVESFSTRATSVEGRVRALVAASWDLHLDPTYQAFREVMRSQSGRDSALDPGRLLQRIGMRLRSLTEDLFPELQRAPRTRELLSLVLFATLSGMAEQQRYQLLSPSTTERQLRVLRRTLVSVLAERRNDRND